MRVVALDPGRTTGYAQGLITDGEMLVVTGQTDLTPYQLKLHLQWAQPDIIICERFEFRKRARKGLDMYPRELIGVVKLYCDEMSLAEPVLQMPGTAMQYFTDTRLKHDGLYKIGKPHANDAVRHILYWFVFGSGFQYNNRGYRAGV